MKNINLRTINIKFAFVIYFVFIIVTSNIYANDNSMQVSDVNFYIKPSILLSLFTYIFYVIIIFIIIHLHKVRVRKLDELVKYRTLELNNEMAKNKELYEHIIELEKNKNNYFVNLSHELRTPLNVISRTQQLLSEINKTQDYIDKSRLEYHLKVTKNNTERLLNIINNIIDTAKVEDGSYHLNLQMEDIVYVVEETCLDMKDYIEARGIELLIEPEIEEKIIQFDRSEIERCIINLLDNARKFTPEGGKIEVKIKDLDNNVKISVSDTGIGIDEKCQKYIFNRFNQVIDEKSEIKCGSGLGLTITKHIIAMHNGEIYVESKANEGSTFTIILPNIVNK